MSTQLTVRAPFSIGSMSKEKKEKFLKLCHTFYTALKNLKNDETVPRINFVSPLFVRDRLLSIIDKSIDVDILRTKAPIQEALFQMVSARCQSMFLADQQHLFAVRKWMSEELFFSWPMEVISIISDYQKDFYWET